MADPVTLPDRSPDRSFSFSLDDEPPSAEDFVRILEEQGFTFDRTTCPIQLRQPKRAWLNEADGVVTYEQWDNA